METREYVCIDLKSFYASVECVARGLDPLKACLVVADAERTEKTICLAVSPALKAYGIPGRPRLFEVVERVREVNARRLARAPGRRFTGEASDADALSATPSLSLSYVIAPPRMALYMECSSRVYAVYLRHLAPEDIHIYSIDEVFLDVTRYLRTQSLTAEEFTRRMLREVYEETGITATAGIGPNLYLAKIAMDLTAKHMPPDRRGFRMARLDEDAYRRTLWAHTPITDFWRVGRGIARRLEAYGMYTMGDVARCSVGGTGDYWNQALLYRLFGVNAELLIDHAWGVETCTMEDIHAYRPASSGMSTGQVLSCPYSTQKARLVAMEMAENLALTLVEKGLVTPQLSLWVGYDVENLKRPELRQVCGQAVTTDVYGRAVPKGVHGMENLEEPTSSTRRITQAVGVIFDRIVQPGLLVRRLALSAARLTAEGTGEAAYQQLNLFTRQEEEERLRRERKLQEAMVAIRQKHGRNAILKGRDLEEGATARERNGQIGGHKA